MSISKVLAARFRQVTLRITFAVKAQVIYTCRPTFLNAVVFLILAGERCDVLEGGQEKLQRFVRVVRRRGSGSFRHCTDVVCDQRFLYIGTTVL